VTKVDESLPDDFHQLHANAILFLLPDGPVNPYNYADRYLVQSLRPPDTINSTQQRRHAAAMWAVATITAATYYFLSIAFAVTHYAVS